MVAKVAIGKSKHKPVTNGIEPVAIGLRHAGTRCGAQLGEPRGGQRGEECEVCAHWRREVNVEMVDLVIVRIGATRPAYERIGRVCRRYGCAVKGGGQRSTLGW